MGDYRKVLKTKWVAICNHCNHQFELNDEWMREKEERDGKFKPFSASSSSTSVFCPECRSFNFRLSFDYKNLYRRRCPKCGEMFETEYSWEQNCPECSKKHVELMASFGSG